MPLDLIAESARLRLLSDYVVLDTEPDLELDEIVKLAATLCEAPIALVSLVDDTRQWFKSRLGLAASETPRAQAFCSHAIADEAALFTVNDARLDPRFAQNPLVTGDPKIVFYAGAALVVEEGHKLGTLCVIDRVPRVLSLVQEQALAILSKAAVRLLQQRRDLTERSAAESRLQAVLTSIGDAVVSTDEQGRMTFLNPSAEALTGWSSAEAKGVSIDDMLVIINEHTREPARNPIQRALSEGCVVGLANHTLLVRRDGTEVPIDDSAAPVRNVRGEIAGAVLVFRDVSEVKRAEVERRQHEVEREALLNETERARRDAELERKRLSLLFEQAPAAITLLRGSNYVVELANPEVCRVWGRTREHVLGKPLFEALPEVAGQGLEEMLLGVRTTGVAFIGRELAVNVARASGGEIEEVFFTFVYQPVTDADGTVESILVVANDVTQTVTARRVVEAAREQAELANQTMDQFLATVSHELRTPLNAILGWVRLLRDDQLSEDERPKAIATIERNAVAQAQLVADLLDVSRIISGKMRVEMLPVDLVDVIQAALDVVRPAAEAKGVRLLAELDPSASLANGDGSRLQQVIWNLLSNAVKFTPRGGNVRVRLTRARSSVEIEVNDSGEGIAPELTAHVFERFRQGDGAASRAHGGLGLGLAIVKNLVELHGGTARVDSAGKGRGATFVIHLPQPHNAISVPPAASRPPPASQYPEALSGLQVLIVDDEEDARDLMVALLRRGGSLVHAAGSVEEALSRIAEEPIDVVITDIGMPGEDGYVLVAKVRALPGKLGSVPVIALTAYARPEDRTRALRAGFTGYVAKPVDPAELFALITQVAEEL